MSDKHAEIRIREFKTANGLTSFLADLGWAHANVPLPVRQLRFWTVAKRAALDYGARHMPGRFLVMHYEDVCARPQPNWQRLLRFLDLPDTLALPEKMLRSTKIGCRQNSDLTVFPEYLIEASCIVQSDAEKGECTWVAKGVGTGEAGKGVRPNLAVQEVEVPINDNS